jgi:hypothetical protein
MKRVITPFNIVLLLLSLFTAFRLNAQVLTSPDVVKHLNENTEASSWEETYLHIDRAKYIAGENIWFSIYTIERETGKLSARSAVAYVELLNPWNRPVIQTRFQLSGGRGEGNFLLPDSISSGTYTVRAYTNWMKDYLPDNCFSFDINVYNPFKGSYFWRKVDSAGSSENILINLPDKDVSTIYLSADTIYGRREKVSFKIGISNNKADQSGISGMSISVTPADVSASCRWINNYMIPGTDLKQNRFESDGHYLSGKIKYRERNVSDPSDFLYMSVQGKVAEFKYAVIDTTGRFTFVLPLDDKLRNLILQPEHADNNMILEIESSFSWILPESHTFKETFNDSRLDAFSELSFNYQATKIYGTRLKKEIVTNNNGNLKKRRFYGIPEMEIFLDDYIRLPVMQEVFFELVPGVLLRSIKSGYDVKIVNPLTGNYYIEPPLIMIDGVIINDLTVLADLNPDIVEKIEVVKTPYLIGDLILHGIVNVITRSGDFSNITMPDYAVVLPYRVIDKPDIFIAPDYTDKQNSLSRIPDLRNTLYWNPSVKADRNGEAEIEFWTSDLPGTYNINIQGISATGEKVSLNKSFMVR